MDLADYRKQLDEIDDQILTHLHQRAEVVKKVGHLKRVSDVENIYVPHREREIITRLKAQNKGRFPVSALENIYAEIISACRSLEKPLHIAFLGPAGTFGHAASLRHFGSSSEFIPIIPQTDIFTEVEAGRVDYGVVAIENSIEGTVRDVLEMFQDTDLQICAEVYLPIDHNLLSKSPLSEITKIYSHTQPFAQCREWLRQNLKEVQQIEVASTSEAARLAANEPQTAALASKLASEIYGVPVVGKSIMDDANNTTRFFVIGHHSASRTGNDCTSILFAIEDEVGALWEVLGVLKNYQINMNKIDSRPSRTKAWEYVFFVDIEGHMDDDDAQIALTELENLCVYVKVLGSYSRGL